MKTSKRAFTFIELLIATLIFSVVVVSIYSVFQAGLLTYSKLDSSYDIYQSARASLNKIESDLKNAFAYIGTDNKSDFLGSNESLEFFTALDYYKDGELNTDICRIEYGWNESNKILTRNCYIGLSAISATGEAESENLVPGAIKVKFEYARKDGESCVWQEYWPAQDNPALAAQQEKSLPLAVRITVSFAEEKFIKIVSLGEYLGK